MNRVMVVAKKEMKQIIKNRGALISVFIFMIIFGGMTSMGALLDMAGSSNEMISVTLNSLLLSLVLLMGVITGYFLSGQTFTGEKTGGTIETLLCSPLSLREIWFGKVMGILIPSYLVGLVIATMMTVFANVVSTTLILPSLPVLVYLLLVVPAYIAFAIGMLGFVQLLLGMKENQIISIIVMVALIGLITGANLFVTEGGLIVAPLFIGVMFIISLILIGIVAFCTRFLSKEKIVTTLP